MVHPNAIAFLHGNGIGPVIGLGLPEVDVADDDILGPDAENTNLVHHKIIRADKGEVAYILDVEPRVGVGEVSAIVTLEGAAEPDDGGRVGAFLLILGALQEPSLEGLAVIEVQHLAATPLTTGHAGAIAHQGRLVHRSHGRRRETRQLIPLTGNRLGTGIVSGIVSGVVSGIVSGVLSLLGNSELFAVFSAGDGDVGRAVVEPVIGFYRNLEGVFAFAAATCAKLQPGGIGLGGPFLVGGEGNGHRAAGGSHGGIQRPGGNGNLPFHLHRRRGGFGLFLLLALLLPLLRLLAAPQHQHRQRRRQERYVLKVHH